MAPRFLLKTTLTSGQLLGPAERPVLQSYDQLVSELQQRFGPDAAALFSEPVASWGGIADPGTVSWYSEASGTTAPLGSLPTDRRAVLEGRLRQDLSRIAAALDDPALGPRMQSALCVRALESLYAVGDRVVLTEWGLVPDGAGPSRETADLLRQSAVAAFLTPSGPAATAPAQQPPVPAPAAPVRLEAPPVTGPRRLGTAWFAVPASLALAAIFLALGYWRGALLAADRAAGRPNTVSVLDRSEAQRTLHQQERLNAALEKQIEDRRHLLEGNVCVADPATLPRLGPDRAATPPAAVVPPPPGGQPFQGNLADLLKQAIVMIVVQGPNDSLGVGTGFFVTPELVVTNRHVVEAANDGQVAVLNVKLGHPLRGKVTGATPSSDIGALDVAIVRVPAQTAIQPLSFTSIAAELDPVIAAGYPALITNSDAGMQRLLQEGDLTAAPQLVLTDGRVQAIQTSPEGVKIMPHGAALSGGNSGGPLVDGCGRVVGINTFIRSDTQSAAHANYAQKSDSVLPFLKAQGASVVEVGGPCSPGAPAAPIPTAPISAAASSGVPVVPPQQ